MDWKMILTIILVVAFVITRLKLHKRAKSGLPGLLAELGYGLERLRAGLWFRRMEIQDFRLTYLDSQKGEDIVFLLHGFGGDKDDWNGFAVALTKAKLRVIAIDLPGSGDSSRAGHAKYDPVSQARRIGSIKKKLNILGKVSIVGVHTGATAGAVYAGVAANDVKGLVLIEPFGIEAPTKSEVESAAERGLSPLTYGNEAELERVEKLLYARKPARSGAIRGARLARGIRNQTFDRGVWRELWTNRPYVLQSVLPEMKVKTLVVWGDTNRVCHQSALPIIEASLPGVTTVQLRGAGHLMFQERPKELGELVVRFLKGEQVGSGKLEKTMVRMSPGSDRATAH